MGSVEETALHLVPEPDPDADVALVRLRARIATDIASDRRSDHVFETLIAELDHRISGGRSAIITIDDADQSRVRASNLPPAIATLIHGASRRRWFGTWDAAMQRRGEVLAIEVAASSLYREHRGTFVEHGMLAARAVPLTGRHGIVVGACVTYLDQSRVLEPSEVDLFDEVTSLAELAIIHDQSRQELLDRIRHDPLTGLENREGLEEKLRRALDTARGHGWNVAVLFVDIDDLTLVNDSLGHATGDLVIAEVADRIRRQVLVGDTVVRFGGDEFIVVLERIDAIAEAVTTADRIRTAIARPLRIADTDLTITVSIGLTIGTGDRTALELIDEGHAAVVRAKQAGRGTNAVHDSSLDSLAGDRLDREVRLREGIDHHEFVLFWQPKVRLETGRIVGAEALVRWEHPDRGILGPDDFIPTAERAGLIDDLSDWVVWQAVREVAAFADVDPDFSVAINLSASQLTRPDMQYQLGAALDSYDVAPERVIVELTESSLADDTVAERMDDLRSLGVRLAIDDFGTGYSSLAYVQQLPVSIVKVDRAFLVGLAADGSGAPVLSAAVAMAHALGLSTTVEGVETRSQLAGLRNLGVTWAQGYLFAEPATQASLVSRMLDESSRW